MENIKSPAFVMIGELAGRQKKQQKLAMHGCLSAMLVLTSGFQMPWRRCHGILGLCMILV